MSALLHALGDDPHARRRPWVLGGASLAVALVAASAAILLEPAPAPRPCAQAGDEINALWSPARRAELAQTFAASELVYAAETWTRVEGQLERRSSARGPSTSRPWARTTR